MGKLPRVFLIFCLLILPASNLIRVYGHGLQGCIFQVGGCTLRGSGESYSENYLDMNNDSQKVLKIKGAIENLNNYKVRLVPYVSVDALTSNPTSSFDLNNLLRLYPLYNDPASWYFRVESNLTNPLVIEPHEKVGYEIDAYPLKAGTYHVHSVFVFDYVNDRRYRFYEAGSAGTTVFVKGSNMPTVGELTQLFLPFGIGAVTIPMMVLATRKTARNEIQNNKITYGIRLYFGCKASLETVWLAGLLSWLLFAAYPAFNSLESRVFSMVGMIAIIAAITIGGYIAALARSKKVQNNFAIGTAIASIVVYFVMNLISYYAFVNLTSSPYDLLSTSGVGYLTNQFYIHYPVGLTALVGNTVAAVVSAVTRKEKYNKKIVAGLASGTVGCVVFMFMTGLI